MAESLTSLPARESRILRLYFGLDGDGPTTLEVVGPRMGVTRVRVRRIEALEARAAGAGKPGRRRAARGVG